MTKLKNCPACGSQESMQNFSNETMHVEHNGLIADVPNLSGQRCTECGEVFFDRDSAQRYADAGDQLVLELRQRMRSEILRIRKKLGLTQEQAAELTGGGHNAFSRYERGEAEPLPAVVNLFKLLDNHPELLKEIRQTVPHR